VGETVIAVAIERAPAAPDESAQVREEFARLIFDANAPQQKKAARFIEQQVGGYIVEQEAGRGGFGAVYLARRIRDNQRVALKVMLSQVAVDKSNLEQFLREVRNISTLKHPHIVEIFDFGSAEGIFYFAMEWCDNGGVDRLIAEHKGKVPLPIAKPIILQALEALAHAHANGFVHRDLKPSNILLASAPGGVSARLADFGLAKSFEKAGMSGLTLTGNYAGTPYFIPREQIVDFKYVKPVSDVWSMGATIYNILTGQFPYEFAQGRDPINVLLNDNVIPIRQRDSAISKPLAHVIDRAIHRNVKERYPTAGEMLGDLKQALP
jgi:serine/threonine protein kinase